MALKGLAGLPAGARVLVDSAPVADAFQLAACVLHGCDALATHDRDFRRVKEVKILDIA